MAQGANQTRKRLHEIIFEADTPAGRTFDLALLLAIVFSVTVVMLESVVEIREAHGELLRTVEWIFTALFTIEYALRLASVARPMRYATSFFGVVDLLAILPTYLSVVIVGTQSLVVIRILRLMRVFRVLKLGHMVKESDALAHSLRRSLGRLTVFLGAVMTLIIILGTIVYFLECEESGFTSIPRSIYWAVVTVTTVGYGDIAPQSIPGQTVAAIAMLLGYAIIAVPTGIITVEMARERHSHVSTQACPSCSKEGHELDAKYCRFCGEAL